MENTTSPESIGLAPETIAVRDHASIAREYFLSGYNCAQAVLCAFEDVTELERDTSLRLISSFGGGLGRLREVCGAMSGAAAVAGVLWGYSDVSNGEKKAEHYALIQEIARRFTEENGSIICRELLGESEAQKSPTPSVRTAEYYKKRPCADIVEEAARIIDEMIAKKGLTNK